MRTIGHHWPKDAPRGDHSALCDICGARWRRSLLRKDGEGHLVCPDEGDGLDARTLEQMNRSMANDSTPKVPKPEGQFDKFDINNPPPSQWYGPEDP